MDERTCESIAELVSAYRDNDVTPEERALVQAHLQNCPSCAARLAYYEKLHSGLKQYLASIPVPPMEQTAVDVKWTRRNAVKKAAVTRAKWLGVPRLAGLALAIAAIFALAVVGVVYLGSRTGPVQAQEILDKAAKVAAGPAALSVRSVELTRKHWIKRSNPPFETVEITGDVHLWWQAPNLWRIESQQSVSINGTVSDQSSTLVVDGKSIWSSTENATEGKKVTITPFESPIDPFGTRMSDVRWFSTFAGPEGDLASLLKNARQCYDPKLLREGNVAGRLAYVIDLGPTKCPSDSAPDLNGRRLIWVDKETFLELKGEQYGTEPGQGLISTYEVTSVRYDGTIDPQVFTFTPPAGAKINDLRLDPHLAPMGFSGSSNR